MGITRLTEALPVSGHYGNPAVPSSSWIQVTNAPRGKSLMPWPSIWISFRLSGLRGSHHSGTVSGRSLRPLGPWRRSGNWRSETFHEHFAVRNRIAAFEGVERLNSSMSATWIMGRMNSFMTFETILMS